MRPNLSSNVLIFQCLAVVCLIAGCARTRVGPTCVSCKPYFVRGSLHMPQRHYEYDKTGVASWYNVRSSSTQKATGEFFDEMQFTAAHRTLPLPTVARITNLRNGRSIIVVIDDRGPFCYNRIIDLSYGSAQALGMARPVPVRVQALPFESLKLSIYIARYCRRRRDPYGRSWAQLYFQAIRGSGQYRYVRPSRPSRRPGRR